VVIAGQSLADGRTGRNAWHNLIGILRRSVFGRLAVYEDVNAADRLGRNDENLVALTDLGARWIDRVPGRHPPNGIVLVMDSSVSRLISSEFIASEANWRVGQ
jgi:hypothetical protein